MVDGLIAVDLASPAVDIEGLDNHVEASSFIRSRDLKKGKSPKKGKASKKGKKGESAKSTKLSKQCRRIAKYSASSWAELPGHTVTARGMVGYVEEDGYLTSTNKIDIEDNTCGDRYDDLDLSDLVDITSNQFDTQEEMADFCKAQCDCECDGKCPGCDVFEVFFAPPKNYCAFYSTAKGYVFKAEIDRSARQPPGNEEFWFNLYYREEDGSPEDFAYCDIPALEDIAAGNYTPTADFAEYLLPALTCGQVNNQVNILVCLDCSRANGLLVSCNQGAKNLCDGTFATTCADVCGPCVEDAITALLCINGKKYKSFAPNNKLYGCVNNGIAGIDPFMCPGSDNDFS